MLFSFRKLLMENPLVAGRYPSTNSDFKLVPINLEVERKYPWRFYYRFIDPELAQLLYDDVLPHCAHRRGFSNGKAYTVGRKSCLFVEKSQQQSTTQTGYGRYTALSFKQSPTLTKIKKQAEEFTNLKFPYALVHIYRTGKDTIPWHRDREATRPDSSIISISLGATRKFRFRKIGQTSGWIAEYHLQSGDMVWMLPGCQTKVMHTVPIEKKVTDWRINVTLRERIS